MQIGPTSGERSARKSAPPHRTVEQQLREQWNQFSRDEQQSIRATVYATANTFVQQRLDKHRYDDALVELACLNELERQSNQIV